MFPGESELGALDPLCPHWPHRADHWMSRALSKRLLLLAQSPSSFPSPYHPQPITAYSNQSQPWAPFPSYDQNAPSFLLLLTPSVVKLRKAYCVPEIVPHKSTPGGCGFLKHQKGSCLAYRLAVSVNHALTAATRWNQESMHTRGRIGSRQNKSSSISPRTGSSGVSMTLN